MQSDSKREQSPTKTLAYLNELKTKFSLGNPINFDLSVVNCELESQRGNIQNQSTIIALLAQHSSVLFTPCRFDYFEFDKLIDHLCKLADKDGITCHTPISQIISVCLLNNTFKDINRLQLTSLFERINGCRQIRISESLFHPFIKKTCQYSSDFDALFSNDVFKRYMVSHPNDIIDALSKFKLTSVEASEIAENLGVKPEQMARAIDKEKDAQMRVTTSPSPNTDGVRGCHL